MAKASADRLLSVAVPAPIRTALTYGAPEGELPRPGCRVLVRLAGRRVTALVVPPPPGGPPPPPGRLLTVLDVLDREPLLDEELLGFVLRAADYYLHPPGEALRAALPPGLTASEKGGRLGRPRREVDRGVLVARAVDPLPGDPAAELKRTPAQARIFERLRTGGPAPLSDLRAINRRARQLLEALAAEGWVELVTERRGPDPLLRSPLSTAEPPVLTQDQAGALGAIVSALEAGGYRAFLLHGVTGSGKTEVYIRAIERALGLGRSALVLVPEIALTPQLVSRFRARFGEAVGVLHSGLREAERRREWARLREGEAQVAIGARSAIFAPLSSIGVVVVDEEHDPSFKQEEGFRYNGRDLALLRARRAGAVAVLGSATPSLESYRNAEEGRFEKLVLPRRVTPRPLPRVELVDLRSHRSGPAGQTVVTAPVAAALRRTLAAREQAIVFLNRRGYAPAALCGTCGEAVRCLGCAVALTYHRGRGLLECHYCGHGRPMPSRCPSCGAEAMRLVGAGTERAEETLSDLLGPEARIARLDSDVAPGRASEPLLDRVRGREVDVLVGTQLVTKGHDLPGVTLVAVLLADASLHLPDFRAAERTFQLLTQVAGRAGRGTGEGLVLVQTYDGSHPAIRHAVAHDYEAFYRVELTARRELGYPPLAHLAAIRLSGLREHAVEAEARRIADAARAEEPVRSDVVTVTGPAPAPIPLIRRRFRYRILLRSAERPPLRRVLSALVPLIDAPRSNVRAAFDVDPVHML